MRVRTLPSTPWFWRLLSVSDFSSRLRSRLNISRVVNRCFPRSSVPKWVPSFLLPKVTVGFADNHRAAGGFL